MSLRNRIKEIAIEAAKQATKVSSGIRKAQSDQNQPTSATVVSLLDTTCTVRLVNGELLDNVLLGVHVIGVGDPVIVAGGKVVG